MQNIIFKLAYHCTAVIFIGSVRGSRLKWTVQKYESEVLSERPCLKLDGVKIQSLRAQTGRSLDIEVVGPKEWKWTVLRNKNGQSLEIKVGDPETVCNL